MGICFKKDAGLGLRTIIPGCLAAGPIASGILTRPLTAGDRTARTVPASPQPRPPSQNLLVFRGQDNAPRPVRSVEDWLRRRAEILAGMGPMPGPDKRCPLDMKVE
jgi:hypothetical protein